MNINRNNYEEYFLLYIDNELSATEKAEVEMFLQTNPDLQMEMDLLKSTVFPSDDIVFPGKQELIKEEIPSGLQEQLLMHIDNELDTSSTKMLEQKIASYKLLQQELATLQKTKLDASEKIIFTDKASLYRKEPARVVGFYFRRFAAAAVLLGVLFSAGYLVLNNENENTDTSSPAIANVKKSDPEQKNDSPVRTTIPNDTLTASADNNFAGISPEKNSDTHSSGVVSNNNNITVQQINTAQQKNIPKQKNILNPRNNNDQLTVEQQKINYPENKQQVMNEELEKTQLADNITPKKQDAALTDNDLTKVDNNNALMASLSGDENNKLMYVDEEKITRSRFGGFIKKVKRVVERNAKIKTGNLRIGGFDVALK